MKARVSGMTFRGLMVLGLAVLAAEAGAATKSDYCYTPPSISDSLEPNVMIVLDNSASMYNFAYDFPDSDGDGFADQADIDGDGTDEWVRSTGYDPTATYIGYFKPDWYYTFSSSYFRESRENTSSNTIDSDEWNGNFLNWLTMRRVDLVKDVLVGGDYNATSNSIVFAAPDAKKRGAYKEVSDTLAANNTPFSTGEFEVYIQGSTAQLTHLGTGDTRKIQVKTSTTPSGIMEKFWDKVRFGFVTFDDTEGAIVERTPDSTDLSNFRNEVREMAPGTYTPMAETLWTLAGYFAQADGYSEMPGVSGGPRPDYSDNRYSTTTDGKDPFYYSDINGGVFAECAQGFVLFLTDGDPDHDSQIPSDLQDFTQDGNNTTSDPFSDDLASSDYFDDLAYYARTTDLRTPDNKDLDNTQNVMLYPVFAFGPGPDLVKRAAMYGGFQDLDGDSAPYTSTDCAIGQDNSDAAEECDEWDEDRDGVPDTFFEADDPKALSAVLKKAITAILERTSSGSTVATISTQTRSGGELLQAYYLPKHTIKGAEGSTEVYWKGFMRGLWTDPAGNIREDKDPGDQQLTLTEDRLVQFEFDAGDQRTKAKLFPDDDGDMIPDTCDSSSSEVITVNSVDLAGLWNAGERLATRDPDTRTIWFNSGDDSLSSFVLSNASTIAPYWYPEIPSDAEAEKVIKYLRGKDNPDGDSQDYYPRQAEDHSTTDYGANGERVWKLGSVITSTPRVLRPGAVSQYSGAGNYGSNDTTHREFVNSDAVQNRDSLAFVGANDGMLHAFYAGKVTANDTDPDVSADLQTEGGAPGKEAWAFIPHNALPYLRWYRGMDTSCHIPTVDYRARLIDAAPAVNNKHDWRTLLVGVMGFGGRAIGCDTNTNGKVDTTLSSSIFVLDVTDPENPELLWERALPDDTLTMTNTAVVHKALEGENLQEGSWYLVAGSGPANVAGAGPSDPGSTSFSGDPSVFIFNLGDGTLQRSISLGETGVAVGEMLMLDPDQDDITDSLMFGTYSDPGGGNGKLYRLQMTGTDVTAWSIHEAATIPANTESGDVAGRPFYAAPGATKDALGNFWVYGATGRYHDEADNSASEDPQFMFGYIESCWGDGANDTNHESGGACSNPSTPIQVQNDLARTEDIKVTGSGSELECRCGASEYVSPTYDDSTDSYSCPDGSDKVITDITAENYDCSASTVDTGVVDCTSKSTLISSVRNAGGWYWQVPAPERMFSKPFVRGGLVNLLGFEPSTGICEFGGHSKAYAVDYRTGTAPPKPVFLSSGGTEGSMGSEVTIQTSIDLGQGTPPLGEGFAAMPSTKEGEVGALTQTSTGQVTPTQQQTDKLDSGILFLRAP